MFHLTTAEDTFFQTHGVFSMVDHILGQKTCVQEKNSLVTGWWMMGARFLIVEVGIYR